MKTVDIDNMTYYMSHINDLRLNRIITKVFFKFKHQYLTLVLFLYLPDYRERYSDFCFLEKMNKPIQNDINCNISPLNRYYPVFIFIVRFIKTEYPQVHLYGNYVPLPLSDGRSCGLNESIWPGWGQADDQSTSDSMVRSDHWTKVTGQVRHSFFDLGGSKEERKYTGSDFLNMASGQTKSYSPGANHLTRKHQSRILNPLYLMVLAYWAYLFSWIICTWPSFFDLSFYSLHNFYFRNFYTNLHM